MRAFAIAGVVAVAVACAPAASGRPSAPVGAATATSAAQSAASELDQLRARGTLIVAIRVEAPPPSRTAGDPAHTQKRAFESSVAALVATRVLGPNAKVELRSIGGDRLGGLDQAADIAMTVDTSAARDTSLVSPAYAAGAIVMASKSGGLVQRPEDVRGQSVAVAMDELGARAIAQAFFQQGGIAVTLDTYQGVSGAATALESGKAVAIVGDKAGVAVVAADRSLSVVAVIAQRPYVIAVRKSAPDLAAAVSDAVRAALASGEIRDAAVKAGFPYEAP
jgi:ABC-type amino acid transport substrate-binding protein